MTIDELITGNRIVPEKTYMNLYTDEVHTGAYWIELIHKNQIGEYELDDDFAKAFCDAEGNFYLREVNSESPFNPCGKRWINYTADDKRFFLDERLFQFDYPAGISASDLIDRPEMPWNRSEAHDVPEKNYGDVFDHRYGAKPPIVKAVEAVIERMMKQKQCE